MTGSRGPLPKPTALKLLEGNPGKRALNLSDGLNPRIEVPSVPKHLGPEARKEWKRITPLLEELGLISGLDRAALGLYCQAVGRLYEMEMAFNGHVDLLVASGAKYHDAVYLVSHAVTPSGYAQQSVIVQLIKSHREQVNRYLMHFGLSPAARARVQPSNHLQVSLPGMEDAPSANAASGFARFAVVPGR
jgi:P27 family predicted phage terminase small subunit